MMTSDDGLTVEQVDGIRVQAIFAEWRGFLARGSLATQELWLLRQRLKVGEFGAGPAAQLMRADVAEGLRQRHQVPDWPFADDLLAAAPADLESLGDDGAVS